MKALIYLICGVVGFLLLLLLAWLNWREKAEFTVQACVRRFKDGGGDQLALKDFDTCIAWVYLFYLNYNPVTLHTMAIKALEIYIRRARIEHDRLLKIYNNNRIIEPRDKEIEYESMCLKEALIISAQTIAQLTGDLEVLKQRRIQPKTSHARMSTTHQHA